MMRRKVRNRPAGNGRTRLPKALSRSIAPTRLSVERVDYKRFSARSLLGLTATHTRHPLSVAINLYWCCDIHCHRVQHLD